MSETATLPGPTLRCSRCGFSCDHDHDAHFVRRSDRPSKYRSWCKGCLYGERKRAYAQKPEVRELHHERTKRVYDRSKATLAAKARADYAARWEEIRERKNRAYTLRGVVQDGKNSPITRRYGFSVVLLAGTDCLRAARLDRPIGSAEIALVRYEFLGGRWFVSLPSVVPAMFRTTAEWAYRLCLRREAT